MNSVSQLITRKIIASSIAGTIFAVFFGIITANPFGEEFNTLGEYIWGVILSTPFYLMYSFPVILVYGTVTSLVSDLLSNLITRNRYSKLEIYVSAIFHLLFGTILLWISFTAAALYFLTDRILARRENYNWKASLTSLLIPMGVWLTFMSFIWIKG